MLLEALCLRRTKDMLPQLPGVKEHTRTLELSSEERNQYEQTKTILLRTIRQRVGEIEKSSKLGLFQMNLQLRIICNHGTFQKPFSWHRRSFLDEKEAIISSFGRHGEICCSVCEQPMPVLGSNWAEGMFDRCKHVLCPDCVEQSITVENGASDPRRCPICVKWHQSTTSLEDDHANYFNEEGVSTKMNALIEDVAKDLWTMKRCVVPVFGINYN